MANENRTVTGARAVIASGSGRYGDPWHPFCETSPLLAKVLESRGFSAMVSDDLDAVMQDLNHVDLLVVNAGDPWRNSEDTTPPPATSINGFRDALDRGIGVLAMHCAVATMRDYPEWAPAVGALWVPPTSMHPPADTTTITGLSLPDGAEVDDFTLFDERYCRLQRLGRSTAVTTHAGPSGSEPSAWVREVGTSRIAVDTLGHDTRSYDSAGHLALIGTLAEWATRPRQERFLAS